VEHAGKSEKVKTVSVEQLSVRCPAIKSEKGGKCGHLCFFLRRRTREKSKHERVIIWESMLRIIDPAV
jgi:hypothetical protein